MTTEADLLGEIADEGAAEQRLMLDVIAAIARINDEIRPLEKMKEAAVAQLKAYMGIENLTELHDGERGIMARIQERKGPVQFDLVTATGSEEGQQAILSAALAGMLSLDGKMLAAYRNKGGSTWADYLDGMSGPGNGTIALTITRDDK